MSNLKNKKETIVFLNKLASARNPVEVHREEGVMHCLLQDISDVNMRIMVIENNCVMTLKKNDFFMIQFVFDGERYQLITRPIRFLQDANSFEVEIPYFIENLNMRTYPRFDFDFTYKAYFPLSSSLACGYVKNISEGGFLLSSDQALRVSESYVFGFLVPSSCGDFKELFFKAKVAHISEREDSENYNIGMQFVSLRKDMKQSIKTLVMALNVWKNLGENSPKSIQKITHPDQGAMAKFSKNMADKFLGNIKKSQETSSQSDINPFKNGKSEQRTAPRVDERKRRILCIVPDSKERNTIKTLISEYYELEFIFNPLGTVNKMISYKPDMVISEINLEEVDFFTIRKAAKNTPQIADVPFVVYTVNNDKVAIVNALRNGNVSEYIIKPILRNELVSRLNNILNIN